MRRVEHPICWLVDLAAQLGESGRMDGAGGRASTHTPPPPHRAPDRPRRRPAPGPLVLTFELLDEHHGPVVECHRVEPRREAVLEWHRVLDLLEQANRLRWWHIRKGDA